MLKRYPSNISRDHHFESLHSLKEWMYKSGRGAAKAFRVAVDGIPCIRIILARQKPNKARALQYSHAIYHYKCLVLI